MTSGSLCLLLPVRRGICSGSCVPVSRVGCCVCPDAVPTGDHVCSYSVPDSRRYNERLGLVVGPTCLLPRGRRRFVVSCKKLATRKDMGGGMVTLRRRCPSVSVCYCTSSITSSGIEGGIIDRLGARITKVARARTTGTLLRFIRHNFRCRASKRRFNRKMRGDFFFSRALCFPCYSYRSQSVFCTCLIESVLKLSILLVKCPKRRYATITLSIPPPSCAKFTCGKGGCCVYSPACVKTSINVYVPGCVSRSPRVRR